jgi:hypothetical protein
MKRKNSEGLSVAAWAIDGSEGSPNAAAVAPAAAISRKWRRVVRMGSSSQYR